MKRGKTRKTRKILAHFNMKKILISLIIVAIILVFFIVVIPALKNKECTSIRSGLLTDNENNPITTGYDQWGYNYQSQTFNGFYDNYAKPETPVTEGNSLVIRWDDEFLSNFDCDGDYKLDMHSGYATYKGSNAELTSRQSGSYELDGKTCHWNYFAKMIAVPVDATTSNGFWYSMEEIEIGRIAGNEFAIVQETYNNPCAGETELTYKNPLPAGFGYY